MKQVSNYFFKSWPKDIPGQREALEKYARAPKRSLGVVCEPVEAGGVPAEWITPRGVDKDRVLLHFHGGGYVMGSAKIQRALTANIGLAGGCRALSVDYRLAPENPFPAALDDSLAAYRWLLKEGIDPAKIIIFGDSSGSGLGLALLVSLRDAGDPLPAGAVCFAPWTDLAMTGDSIHSKADVDVVNDVDGMAINAKHYAGEYDLKDPRVSPLYADLTGLPPLFLQGGTEDVMLDDSTRFAKRARLAGVDVTLDVWPGMIHLFQIWAGFMPEANQAIARAGAFICEKVK
jgi:acetyl esterase/lipase